MKKLLFLSLIACSIFHLQSCQSQEPNYFDQAVPGKTPQLFAPGIVNTSAIELNVVFNSEHTEMFFSRIVEGSFVIFHSERSHQEWSAPTALQLYPPNLSLTVACDPTISADGKTLYFLGVDPTLYREDISLDSLYRIPPDIYKSEKVNGQWQLAEKVPDPVSTEGLESYPIVVGDGSLYFIARRAGGAGGSDIFRAQYTDEGTFRTPTSIPVNDEQNATSTYVNFNENLIVASSRDGFKVYRKENDAWKGPFRVDIAYEEGYVYFCPYMSPDGKYFFYTKRYSGSGKPGWAEVTEGEVFWVSAEVLGKN